MYPDKYLRLAIDSAGNMLYFGFFIKLLQQEEGVIVYTHSEALYLITALPVRLKSRTTGA